MRLQNPLLMMRFLTATLLQLHQKKRRMLMMQVPKQKLEMNKQLMVRHKPMEMERLKPLMVQL